MMQALWLLCRRARHKYQDNLYKLCREVYRMLAKVRYDKSTTQMDSKEQSYWMHFLRDEKGMVGDYIRSQIRQNPTFRRELMNQPVCSRCEGFTFFHQGGAQCSTCGTWTPMNQTHKVKIHLKDGHYRWKVVMRVPKKIVKQSTKVMSPYSKPAGKGGGMKKPMGGKGGKKGY